MTFYSAQHDYFACAIFFLFFSVTAAPHAKNSESSPSIGLSMEVLQIGARNRNRLENKVNLNM